MDNFTQVFCFLGPISVIFTQICDGCEGCPLRIIVGADTIFHTIHHQYLWPRDAKPGKVT